MLEKIKNLKKRTRVILIAVALVLIAGVGTVITACTVTKSDDGVDENATVATESATELATEEVTETATEEATEETTEKATEETTEEATEKPTEKKDKSDSDKDEDKDKENDTEEATVVITTTTTGGGNNDNNSNNNSNNNTSTGNTTTNNNTQTNSNNNTTTNNNTPSKVWHEAEYKTVHHPAETKKVWVIDQEGYTYEEPIYEEHGVTICNNCEIDITNNCTSHMKQHALNRESASYRDEWREVQVGTKTITVEEKGHWETQVVKEAWDEQVLIREAGYY